MVMEENYEELMANNARVDGSVSASSASNKDDKGVGLVN
jgi:hypothetical protein